MASLESTETMCPVCTLFLRPGITLKQHLSSHPKQKVIDALVKLSLHEESLKVQSSQQNEDISQGVSIIPQSQQNTSMSPYLNQVPLGHSSNMAPLPGNHFFMYQQSMSTSSPHQSNVSPLPFNPFSQQYLVPTVYNAQMMPYFYQQQQLIMSSNGIPPHIRALPFEASSSGQINPVTNRLSELSAVVPKEKRPERDCEVDKITESEQEDLNNRAEDRNGAEIEETEVELMHEDDPLSIKEQEHEIDSNYKDEEEVSPNYKDEQEINTNYKDEQDDDSANTSLSHDENSFGHDCHAHVYQENNEEYEHNQIIDHEECIGTPLSHVSNSEWNFNSDLNKACQTQINNTLSPRSSVHNDEQSVINNTTPDYFFIDQRTDVSVVYTSENVPTTYEQAKPIYTSANILNNSDGVDFMNVDDIEGMQVILGDFPNALVVSHENYDTVRQESPPILMTISGMNVPPKNNDGFIQIIQQKNQDQDDNCIDNVNIRSDEKMPPRGELSGQESMGSASDLTWNQIQHYQEQGNRMCFEQNSWDNSSEIQSFAEENQKIDIETGGLVALKEEDSKENIVKTNLEKFKKSKPIGLDIGKNKPRKLLIKQKRQKKEIQNNFNNVFKNKLKTENGEMENFDNILTSNNIETFNKQEIKFEEVEGLPNMCKQCDKIFKTIKELKIHNAEFHKRLRTKGSKCQICNELFDVEHKFNEHLKIHPLECHMCGKLFYRRQGLKLHIARHEGIKPYKCDLCEKAFLVKQKLEEHRNCHTGNAPIKCNMCNETFKRHSNLVQHRNRHHLMIKQKLKDYVCYCGEVFHSKKKLAWHKEIHDSKPKSCTQCSEKFIHMASLTRHMRRAHNAEYLPDGRDPNAVNKICPVCKGVYLKSSLEAHLKTHKNSKPFSCSICNKEFTTKWNLKLHKWTHASRTQKPFKCDLCKGAFIRENDYIAHMNSHKSVRPYTCNYCGAPFIRKYNCQRHVKEHENDKTYVCNVCGKSFHRSYYLKDHMRVHSGIRPYACHICGKTSTTKSNHNKHVQIHHAREPVSTEN